MNTRHFARIALAAAALAAACAAPANEPLGRATQEARVRQTQNPGAGEIPNTVQGQGPGTAEDVLANYHENQKTQNQQARQRRQRQNGLTNLGAR